MKFSRTRPVKIVMLGAGGTGGHIAPHLYRLLYALARPVRFILCDGDVVEEKNLVRQNFIPADLGENKARVLAERYSTVFGMETEYIPAFVEDEGQLRELLTPAWSWQNLPGHRYGERVEELVILIGAVDNNKSRQLCHRVFHQARELIYIDSGNGEYTGQVVCGVRRGGRTYYPPIGAVYPDVLEETDKFPTQLSCAEASVSAPQSMAANITAATAVVDMIYNILAVGNSTVRQTLVVWRARVESYRAQDLTAARDAYDVLLDARKQLAEVLSETRLLLMEAEEYKLAAAAGQLQEGLLGFDLMSNAYRPVYDALNGFAARLPVDGTANARVVGRLMNNIKMGYYPTDPDNIGLILRGVQFPEGMTTNLLDPCCGCGKALRQIAEGNNCFTYGVELDEHRAEEAQTRLHRVGFGSFFYSRISHETFHLLFLNPPYLSVLNESGGRARHEKRFLIESLCHLTYGGLLAYVIPYYRLTSDICRVLVDNFENLGLWRFTDSEFKKFKQIAVLGTRKRRDAEPQDTQWLEWFAAHPASIPSLAELSEGRYALPAKPLEVGTFMGERFNKKELERQLSRSDSFRQMMARSELDSGVKRPPLPLSISQIGLIGGSGMINGLIECDTPHIIKGRVLKVTRTETEERFNTNGKYMGAEVHETITNKMIFNILTPNGFRALT